MYKPILDSFYEISEMGKIRNIKSGRVLKPALKRTGYLEVCLSGKRWKG